MRRRLILLLAVCVASMAVWGCSPREDDGAPQAQDFKTPAVGTPVMAGQDSAPVSLPPGSSGVLMMNQQGGTIQVAVGESIATIPHGQGFLFILPPDTYDFLVYDGVSLDPMVHTERTEANKVRYVYLLQTK